MAISTPPKPGMHDISFEEFQSWYGPWRVMRPTEVHELLGEAPFPYWIAGGWAVDAVAGTERFHEDVDVVILRRDLDAFREHMAGKHLWTAHIGALKPLWPGAELPEENEQLWVRDDAYSPWTMDVLLTPTEGDRILFKRDHSIGLDVAEATFVGDDGVHYLAPELVLLYKARLGRDKDDADFAGALPNLSDAAKAWLAAALDKHLQEHAWRPRL